MHGVAVASAFVSALVVLVVVVMIHRACFSIRQMYLSNKQYVQVPQGEYSSDGFPSKSENGEDVDGRATSKKSYELCVGAANHIASIGTLHSSMHKAPMMLIGIRQ